jgi:hypothetical protein
MLDTGGNEESNKKISVRIAKVCIQDLLKMKQECWILEGDVLITCL